MNMPSRFATEILDKAVLGSQKGFQKDFVSNPIKLIVSHTAFRETKYVKNFPTLRVFVKSEKKLNYY